jgi:glycosyltransferase involved in cell wall biosynthesis
VRRKLKVAIFGLYHGESAGGAKQLKNYLKFADNDADIQYTLYIRSVHMQEFNSYTNIDKRKVSIKFDNAVGTIVARLYLYLINKFSKKYDVIIDFFNPIALPSGARNIVIIRDLAEMFLSSKYDKKRMFYRKYIMLPLSMRFSNYIVCISQSTANDLIKINENIKDKIVVIHHGADQRKQEALLVRQNYFLHVGRLDIYGKNLLRLIESYRIYIERGGKCDLYLVGAKWRNTGLLYEKISQAKNIRSRIFIPGYLSNDELEQLYSNAKGFVFVSLYEGFGHPILESYKHGTPVLTSNLSSMPEIGGDASIYVNPYDVEAVSEGLLALEKKEVDENYLDLTNEIVSTFTWKKMYKKYKKLVASGL